jgi:signal peptidase I
MTDTTITEPDPEPDAPAEPRKARRSQFRRNIEWVLIVAVAVLSALLVKTYLIEAFYIPSGSMEPTLKQGDRVLVNKLSYRLHDVNRGDIIVFERPKGVSSEPQIRDFIKRVVGLPGEVIETRADRVYIDGKPLKEDYLPPGTKTVPSIEKHRIQADHYWVMGDNRTNSSDSRFFGEVEEDTIIGRAFFQVWPLFKFELL